MVLRQITNKILDTRTDTEAQKEIETQREVDGLLMMVTLLDGCDNKPDSWIKKYGKKFKHLMDFKSHHFNQRLK